MKRQLFNLAAGLSMLLCVATAALWGRSYGVSDAVFFDDGVHVFSTDPGRISMDVARPRYWMGNRYSTTIPRRGNGDQFGPYFWFNHQDLPTGNVYACLGFIYYNYTESLPPRKPVQFTSVHFPLWFVFGFFAVLPACWANLKRREMKRKMLGLCVSCGYDLRATPDRCPECGTPAVGTPAVGNSGQSEGQSAKSPSTGSGQAA